MTPPSIAEIPKTSVSDSIHPFKKRIVRNILRKTTGHCQRVPSDLSVKLLVEVPNGEDLVFPSLRAPDPPPAGDSIEKRETLFLSSGMGILPMVHGRDARATSRATSRMPADKTRQTVIARSLR